MINNLTRKQFNSVSGIYKITNTVNGKIYIGRSKNLYYRMRQYFSGFKYQDKTKINEYLLRSMSKYGFENFTFEVLEICENYLTPKKELEYILKMKSNNKGIGYNFRLDTDAGKMLTDKRTSEKISKRLKIEWSKGVRKDHSEKLKASWDFRDRLDQSKRMTRNLTKYFYIINDEQKVDYQGLVSLGLTNSLNSFHKTKRNSCFCKGNKVERVLI